LNLSATTTLSPPAVSLPSPSKGPALSLPAVSLSNLSKEPALSLSKGFTLIEVMMAAVILVVGFVGMIEAVTLSAKMMDSARRQTLAAQIMNHEIEQLRLQSWSAINALPTTSTNLGAAYSASTTYAIGDTVTSGGAWYRCSQAGSGHTPAAGSAYWNVDTPPYANSVSTSGVALGATYSLTRTVADPATNLREVTLKVQWIVTTSRRDSSNNPLTFTYSRVQVAYFGKYGLNLTYQRS